MRLSHSGKNKYLTCARSYQLHYIERWRSLTVHSPLFFGSAIDSALNVLLSTRNLDEAKITFAKNMEQGKDVKGNIVDWPKNPNVKYSKYDWDSDLLDKPMWSQLFSYNQEFFNDKETVDIELKTKSWNEIQEGLRSSYNFGVWLCMVEKGKHLLNAYAKDILPEIKEVIANQLVVELDDGDGNILNGVVDAIVKLNDGRVVLLDNKTSASEYEPGSVKASEQLATYKAILDIKREEGSFLHKIDACGYAVMLKKLNKEVIKVCTSCGHNGLGAHKTCDNTLDNGKRCGGAWNTTKKFSAGTQLIIDTIDDKFAQEVLENAYTVKSCIEKGLFPKNYNACYNMYGNPCVYVDMCHKNKYDGLEKVEEKNG